MTHEQVSEWRARAGRKSDLYNILTLEIKTTDQKWFQFDIILPESRFDEPLTQGVQRTMESEPFFGRGYQWDIPSQSYDNRFYMENGTINPVLFSTEPGAPIEVHFTGKMYVPIEE